MEDGSHVGPMFHVELPLCRRVGDGGMVRHVVHPGVPLRWYV